MRKKIWIALSLLLAVCACTLGGIKLYRMHKAAQCGLLLAFDDYNGPNWEEYFDLFDQYDAKVTFFINAYEPVDFCFRAIDRGHEIAYHTAGHANLTECSQEEIYTQAIAPMEAFRQQGIELTTFAYPYGAYTSDLNDLLLQHYKVLRGAFSYQIVGKDKMLHGVVDSLSLDNINYPSDEAFEERVDAIVGELSQNKGAVVGVYSHAIGDGNWCISEKRLEYLLKKAREAGIQFYTYQELQEEW